MGSAVATSDKIRLRAVVLMAGSVRATELSRHAGRSLLDLPIEQGRTILDAWRDQVAALDEHGDLVLDVVVDQTSMVPRVENAASSKGGVPVYVKRDAESFRGTGGVLRDVAREYAPDDVLLVCNAAQILIEPLARVTERLMQTGGDVSMMASDDGLPGGVMLVRCRVLSGIRDVGFVDFKEQVLPKLAAEHRIGVSRRPHAPGLSIRTTEGYIDGVLAHHRLKLGAEAEDPFAEEWSRTFGIVESTADVAAESTVHDSVILAGGRVEAGAVVVRSVVCPGGVVKRGQSVVDATISSASGAENGRARS